MVKYVRLILLFEIILSPYHLVLCRLFVYMIQVLAIPSSGWGLCGTNVRIHLCLALTLWRFSTLPLLQVTNVLSIGHVHGFPWPASRDDCKDETCYYPKLF